MYPSNEKEYWCERFNEEQRLMQNYYDELIYQTTRPSTIYKPKLFIDGDKWCALYGENIQDGVAGFGDSPAEAFENFDRNWRAELLRKDLKKLSIKRGNYKAGEIELKQR